MLGERCRLPSRWGDGVGEFIARTKKGVIEAGLLCWVRDAGFLVDGAMGSVNSSHRRRMPLKQAYYVE